MSTNAVSRRKFITLSSSAVAAGVVLPITLLNGEKAWAAAPNSVALNNSTTAHASTVAAVPATPAYFGVMASALSTLYTSWVANGTDTTLKPAYQSVQDGWVHTVNLNMTAIDAVLNTYPNPTVAKAQYTRYLADLEVYANEYIDDAIYELAHEGMAPFISLAQSYAASASEQSASVVLRPDAQALLDRYQVRNGISLMPTSGCAISNAGAFFLGTAFLVIGVMTLGSAPILMGVAWATIATWGGIGAGVWGGFNAMFCEF